ncbi:MAG: class B sortase [Oscillospiraceae bacterium]|jgi:SrtB family sortase|nr:class B sortase [Oscillospiraceae bacterium]
MDNERRPASDDALEALDAVVNTPPARRKKNFFEKNIIPLRGDSRKTKRRKAAFDSCLVVIFVCLLVLAWVVVIDPMQSKKLFDDLENMTVAAVTEAPTEPPPPGETAPPTVPTTADPRVYTPMSHDQLKAKNGDYRGWLRAPGASISLPIVQTANNNYYLKRDFNRKPSKYGNPFVDYRCDFNPASANLLIYGHHMSNGTIFTYLPRYKQADVVRNNPIITLELPDGTVNKYKIVSVLAINGREQDDNGYAFAANTPSFPSAESFNGYVRQIKARSYVDTGVDVEYGDKLISLQTCIYDFEYEFLYVIGRLVRPHESTAVTGVKANPNPRLPQALYDKLKKTNPFPNGEKWYAP